MLIAVVVGLFAVKLVGLGVLICW